MCLRWARAVGRAVLQGQQTKTVVVGVAVKYCKQQFIYLQQHTRWTLAQVAQSVAQAHKV